MSTRVFLLRNYFFFENNALYYSADIYNRTQNREVKYILLKYFSLIFLNIDFITID